MKFLQIVGLTSVVSAMKKLDVKPCNAWEQEETEQVKPLAAGAPLSEPITPLQKPEAAMTTEIHEVELVYDPNVEEDVPSAGEKKEPQRYPAVCICAWKPVTEDEEIEEDEAE